MLNKKFPNSINQLQNQGSRFQKNLSSKFWDNPYYFPLYFLIHLSSIPTVISLIEEQQRKAKDEMIASDLKSRWHLPPPTRVGIDSILVITFRKYF